MPHTCKCGGRLRPYMENELQFKKRCDNCGVIRTQKKRLPKDGPKFKYVERYQ